MKQIFQSLKTGATEVAEVPCPAPGQVLILNMGEAALFSPGGIGLLPLILLGWAYASGLLAHRLRHG